MEVVIYTKPDCSHCETAKELLKNYDVQYAEHQIGQDITREEVLDMFPWAKTVPIILVDEQPVTSTLLKAILEQYNNGK